MFSKPLPVLATVASLFIATCHPDEAQSILQFEPTLAAVTNEPAPCYECIDLLVGSYFFDGTEIWVPNAGQIPLPPENETLSIEVDWDVPSIIFSSSQYKFCKRPPKVWTHPNSSYQDLWLYECEPIWTSTTLSTDKHELSIELDADFLQCAFGADMAGFKFAVPIY